MTNGGKMTDGVKTKRGRYVQCRKRRANWPDKRMGGIALSYLRALNEAGVSYDAFAAVSGSVARVYGQETVAEA